MRRNRLNLYRLLYLNSDRFSLKNSAILIEPIQIVVFKSTPLLFLTALTPIEPIQIVVFKFWSLCSFDNIIHN